MGNDKMNTCVEDWIEFQQQKLSSMSIKHVRIETGEDSYYGRLRITKKILSISPDDPQITPYFFEERHLNGVDETGSKGIKISKRFGKPSFIIYFRSTNERNIALEKIRILISDESTSSSSSSPEGSNTTDPGPSN
ncbi:uncharacterized protein [Euwallacea similis]|uniref:uncharacterized protein n=1 Tax=Euwallacea similis TaxID=1736056 RepID=UPI00344D2376